MYAEIIVFLRNHSLLHGVSDSDLEVVASTMEKVCYKAGDQLIVEGAAGNECYFILNGQVQVLSKTLIGKQVVLAELGPGSLIGEIALLQQEKRTAGVKALGDVDALRLDRASFQRLAEASPYFHESLSYSAEIRIKHGLLRKASIWSAIPDSELRGLAEITVRRRVQRGETIVREGESADRFFMISKGRFEKHAGDKRTGVLGAGDYFGEIALLAGVPHTDSLTALEDSELLVMGKDEFHYILQHYVPVRQHFLEVLRIRRPDLSRTAAVTALLTETELSSSAAGKWSKAKHARYDSWIDLLFRLGGLFLAFTLLAIWHKDQIWVIASLLTGGLVGPVTFVSYVRSSQLLVFRPAYLVIVFVSSAIVAVPLAWLLERTWLFDGGVSELAFTSIKVPLTTAVIEETLKLLICVGLVRAKRTRFLMDALVFGAAAGMGFSALESVIYGWTHLNPDSAWGMLAVLWVRSLLSPFGHGTWTAITAAGLWYAMEGRADGLARNRVWWRTPFRSAGLLLSAVVLHTLWNFQIWEGVWKVVAMIIVGSIGLLLLGWLIRNGVMEERRALSILNPSVETNLSAENEGIEALRQLICDACGTQSPADTSYCARCGQALRSG
ncbi:cyclic nucleotide-binding domain-containing protein [Paenibacillus filicis]|uniref:Cyclic nucleotide-binding domain-containing protein n=1 Tax=Paenibacillus gyeongsangnamensis TaxID=3388067 RepID=A0ABT4QHR5_9BACL|nr:cyclic nucleotide-binding domain-containing protein [Paenibacillus filicis]MCZ8516392.1 cyclic nucleotide-binding domain-containing protein [Paenibacillus filicis]